MKATQRNNLHHVFCACAHVVLIASCPSWLGPAGLLHNCTAVVAVLVAVVAGIEKDQPEESKFKLITREPL